MPVDGYQSTGINDSCFLHLGRHKNTLMSHSITGTLRQKKNQILTLWMRNQLADGSLRDDLMSNDDLRAQSVEILDCFFDTVTTRWPRPTRPR